MGAESFITWLSGFFDMANPTSLDAAQVKLIKEKLNSVGSSAPYTPIPSPTLPLIPRPDKVWPTEWDDGRAWPPRGLEIRD